MALEQIEEVEKLARVVQLLLPPLNQFVSEYKLYRYGWMDVRVNVGKWVVGRACARAEEKANQVPFQPSSARLEGPSAATRTRTSACST